MKINKKNLQQEEGEKNESSIAADKINGSLTKLTKLNQLNYFTCLYIFVQVACRQYHR